MAVADWTLILLLAATLFTLCTIRSRTRLLWADELFGYRVLGAPTFMQMLRGWWQGADGGGLFYYLPARLWVRLFGLSELTLRLFSTAGMCVALALTWTAARRYLSTFVVALSIGIVYLTPPAMLWQEVNGRFYGSFLAAASFASLLFLITAEEPLTRQNLALTAAAHALLIGSHILGLVYSFSLIVGMITLDRRQHRTRWMLYLAAAAGWIMVPISWHAIRASSAIATNIFWTYRPSLYDLLLGFAVFGRATACLLAATAFFALLRLAMRSKSRSVSNDFSQAVPFLVGSVVLAQLILFGKSQFRVSIYSDRYLLPMSIVAVFLFGALLAFTLPGTLTRNASPRMAFLAGLLVLLPCGAFACWRNPNHLLYPPRGSVQAMATIIPHDAPVLASLPFFTLLTEYDPTHTYLFSLDWSYDLAPGHPSLDYSGERIMENWKRAGYEPDHIQPCQEIFATHPDVYILVGAHRTRWFEDRLRHNPAFELRWVADLHQWDSLTLWAVHRKGPGSLPC